MKIAFVDIDGTILDYSRGINFSSEKTLRVFQLFREKGHKLIIATSRSKLPDGLKKEMFDGFIFSNGQYIEYNHEVLLNNHFSKLQIRYQQSIYEKYGAGAIYSGVNGQWISPVNKHLAIDHMVHFGLDPNKADSISLPFNINDIESTAATGVFGNVESMHKAKEELPLDWIIHVYEEESIRMDVHLPGITKGSSCMFLVDHIGIEHHDSYAFGDGVNDIEMLELVGHGVAMGNAIDEVKKIANFVAKSIEEDGLANSFKELFDL